MLARLRSAVFSIFLVIFVAIMGIACMPAALFGQKASRSIVQLWSKIGLVALRWITGIRYRIEGAENIPSGGALIASNHQSMWETVALYALSPNPVLVFKKELSRIPIYGWWASFAGNISVDRKTGAKALRAMTRAAKDNIEQGAQVVIFPEGTRTPIGETRKFQPGIAGIYAAANAPCVPVAHNSGKYWRHPGGKMYPGEITLRFLEPIQPGLDRKEFLRQLKLQIEAARPDLVSGENTNDLGSHD